MPTPIRRTEDGWELTARMVAVCVGLLTIAGFFVTVTAAAVGARQQLASSTPITRHDSLVRAVSENKNAIDTLRANLLGLNCQQSHYPSPFCDRIPRVIEGPPR